jgi:hypothetical protein
VPQKLTISKRIGLTLFAAALVPPVVLFALIRRNSVNVPHWEEWTFLIGDIFRPFYEGQGLSFLSFWKEGGQHIVFFPALTAFAIGVATRINFHFIHYANFAVLALSFVIPVLLLVRFKWGENLGNWRRVAWAGFPAIASSFWFSLTPAGAYLWGLSLYIFISILSVAAVASLLAAFPGRWLSLLAITLFIWIAALSNLNGFALSAVATMYAGLRVREERSIKNVAQLCILGSQLLMVLFLFASNPGTSSQFSELNLFGHGIGQFSAYVLAYLGTPVNSLSLLFAIYMGAIGVAAFFAAFGLTLRTVWRNGISKTDPIAVFFLMIMLYAIGTALLTAIGREGREGLIQALTDRYVAFASLLWVGVCYFLMSWSTKARTFSGSVAFSALCLGTVYLGVRTSIGHLDDFELSRQSRMLAKEALITGQDMKSVNNIYPGGIEPIRDQVEFLKRARLGPFENSAGTAKEMSAGLVTGEWKCGGKPARIVLVNNVLFCINETGAQSRARIRDGRFLLAIDWKVSATLSLDGKELKWSNGTVWSL